MELLQMPLYCAVDREPIEGRTHYALTVNALTGEVVMLTFCLNHHAEWLKMRDVVAQEGWR